MLRNQEWETLQNSDHTKIERIKIHNGWLVTVMKQKNMAACYVPDKRVEWVEKNDTQKTDSTLLEKLSTKISSLKISTRVINTLISEGYHYVGDIVCDQEMIKQKSFSKLLFIPNCGKTAFREIVNILHDLGFDNPFVCDEYNLLNLEKLKNER